MALHVIKRLQAYSEPALFVAAAFYGLFPDPLMKSDSLSPGEDKIIFKKELETALPSLVAQASGTVVEVGPGSGNQLCRYDKARVSRIYGMEPNADLHDALRATIKQCGLSDIYTIVPCGVEDLARLESFGITQGSVDTVLSVQVFCSVPQPKEMMVALYKVLKPGGQMIVYEHVESKDPLSRAVQGIYQVLWPYLMGNCNLTRPTGDYILKAGEWSTADMTTPEKEDPWMVIPHISGRLVKAG
ncbi:MAG: hypothetical protein Q9217_002507 [Psora testacea]